MPCSCDCSNSLFKGARPIFVFGSNEAGIHGAGAALHARQRHGAILGRGIGLQGQSYAIPTKDRRLRTLPLSVIHGYVQDFVHFALDHPSLMFEVTRIGCGLAGYTDADIAPLFRGAPTNCRLPAGWVDCRYTATRFSPLAKNEYERGPKRGLFSHGGHNNAEEQQQQD